MALDSAIASCQKDSWSSRVLCVSPNEEAYLPVLCLDFVPDPASGFLTQRAKLVLMPLHLFTATVSSAQWCFLQFPQGHSSWRHDLPLSQRLCSGLWVHSPGSLQVSVLWELVFCFRERIYNKPSYVKEIYISDFGETQENKLLSLIQSYPLFPDYFRMGLILWPCSFFRRDAP